MSSAPATVQVCRFFRTAAQCGSAAQGCGNGQLVNPGTAEVANSITHGLGLLLSVIAAAVLMTAARHGDLWQLIACGIYSGTMISVYATSTLSHVFQHPRRQHFFRMLDQGCIYLYSSPARSRRWRQCFCATATGGHYWRPCGRSPPEALSAKCFCAPHRWRIGGDSGAVGLDAARGRPGRCWN